MKLTACFASLLTTLAMASAPLAFADTGPAPEASPAAAHAARAHVSVVGEVGRYVVGPLGHVRGFVLKDGTVVMVHDAAGDAMAKDVPIGQSVRVEGVRDRANAGSLFRAAVYGQHGQIVAAPNGREHGSDPATRQERRTEVRDELEKLPAASANGTVAAVLEGHHGKTVGVVLSDGTSVFLRPSLVKALAGRGIRVGDRIDSTGRGAVYPIGASVLARSVTFGDGAHFEVQRAAR